MITGSFAEFRKYYFHRGLDFATEGRTGVPIQALTSGKIATIQSLRYSIGNAIILKHDDGFSSRYGHMEKFSEKVLTNLPEPIRKKIQDREDFVAEILPDSEIKIEKGEVIGYSGDTGIGPAHLHVELFKEDHYYNPADFLDTSSQSGDLFVTELTFQPLNGESFLNGSHLPLRVKLNKSGKDYIPVDKNPILIKGNAGIYLSGYQKSGRANRIGFQKIQVLLNKELLQTLDFSKIPSHQMIRSCFVFDNFKSKMSGRPFRYTLFLREEKALDVFQNSLKHSGVIQSDKIIPGQTNQIELNLQGLNKIESKVILTLESDTKDYPPIQSTEKIFNVYPNTFNSIFSEDRIAEAFFPAHSVFSSEYFTVTQKDLKYSEPGITQITPVYGVRPDFREFDKGYELYLRLAPPPAKLPEKIGLYSVNSKGVILSYLPFASLNTISHIFKHHSRTTGYYAVFTDHSPPKINVIGYNSGHTFNNSNFRLLLRGRDSGSGIPQNGITVTIDGNPAKVDYEPEKMYYEVFSPDSIRNKGFHRLEAIAKDYMGNESEKLIFEYTVQ
ncbi:MAG: M23 family metallopeptidase [Leptospiraceae bacterium]|nr:M23 family metallopeptidase [Leptospiraceae bacterium]MCP5512821.1 M23 family metallopeptidase [Leptospiraceae bacterium]